MRYPGRSRAKAGLEFYARLFPKKLARAVETPLARAECKKLSPEHSTQSSKRGTFDSQRLPEALAYYLQELPALKGRGEWRQAICCFHQDKSPSLSVNIVTGGFYCHACQAKGGDVLDFHMLRHGLTFQAAAKQLGAWIE